MSERRARRRRQPSPRSPSFILVAVPRFLPSLLHGPSSKLPRSHPPRGNPRPSYTIASKPRTKRQASTAEHIVAWYLICASTQQPQQRFRPNWSSASSASLCHHAAHRHGYPLGGYFWFCLCRWQHQRVSGAFRGRCDSLLFLCRWRLCR